MRSVTHPLDNAALASLAKRSQLIGQAVQEDRWRDLTSHGKYEVKKECLRAQTSDYL